MADLGMVSNLRRSNSSLCKTRRLQHLFGNSAKQENLSSWIPENITKKECMYFVESSKLSDAGAMPSRSSGLVVCIHPAPLYCRVVGSLPVCLHRYSGSEIFIESK
eukprot:XP_013967623.2 transient receptor potential cation channel subfamily M member 2-like [Canis lupus familiaris]